MSAPDGVVFLALQRPHQHASSAATSTAAAATATVALYAGMTASELQSVVRAALALPSHTQIAGFACSLRAKKSKNGGGGARERIVPLSVACLSPEVLASGGATVRPLLSAAVATTAAKLSYTRDASTSARLERLVAALRDDDNDGNDDVDAENDGKLKRLRRFEAAVLTEICEQRSAEVLQVMASERSLQEKKQFLLSLVRRQSTQKAATAMLRPVAASPTRDTVNSSVVEPNVAAQIDLICKKVVSIAHTVFSPHVQSDLMTEASLFREKHRRKAVVSGATSTTTDVSVSSIVELLGVVERLLNKHALEEEPSVKLIRLILAENRLLFSALQQYKIDFNLHELENTVKRMAAIPDRGSASQRSSPVAPTRSPRRQRSSSSPRKSTKRKEGKQGFLVGPQDILHTLHRQQMITTLERDLLRALVDQNDTQVLAAVDRFEQQRDLSVLREQLVSIVEEITAEIGDDEKMAPGRPMGLMAMPGAGRDDDDALAAALYNWQERLIQLVQRWFSQRQLTADHVHVLRSLIEENHNLLQSAYEVYATDGDESELLDTLQRIAKLQLQAQEGALLHAFTQVVDEHCDVLRDHEKGLVKQLFARRNELVRAAWEVFEVERNAADFGDTLLRIARFTTRQDTKMRLVEVVGEMLRRQLIRSHEADGLLRLFEEKNEAMVAANEAFESDGDVKELVETLLLVVKHANFGDAPRCSSPRHPAAGSLSPTGKRLPMTPPSTPVSDRGSNRFLSPPPPPPFSASSASSALVADLDVTFSPDSDEYFAARLVEILSSNGRLAKWQAQLLLTLLSRGDDRLLAVIDVYNEDRNARELVDSLWRLCDLTAWDQNKAKLVRDWVEPLERDDLVPRGLLQELIEARDDRVVAAFVVYLGDGNGLEFRDTLLRLGQIIAKQRGVTVRSASPKRQQQPVEEASEVGIGLDDVALILKALVNDGEITAAERSQIEARVAVQDAATLAAFDVLAETQDTKDCVDTLKRILGRGTTQSPAVGSPSKTGAMEKQLLHFASELELNPQELTALKRCIARKDSIVEAAIEVYEMEKDEEDLKDTLRRIAVHLGAAEDQ
ncbi:hypothetical protein ATCC90586_004444 [Pythium insidiosum]|nr:hypothetical protein ATCC90586_004444 [Pythium insidiosum]